MPRTVKEYLARFRSSETVTLEELAAAMWKASTGRADAPSDAFTTKLRDLHGDSLPGPSAADVLASAPRVGRKPKPKVKVKAEMVAFRLTSDQAAALVALARDDESRNQAAKRIVLEVIENFFSS